MRSGLPDKMTSMRFITFEFVGRPRPGVLSGKDSVIDLSAAGFQSVLQIIQSGKDGLDKTKQVLAAPPQSSTHAMNAVRLLAPIARPPKLICVGLIISITPKRPVLNPQGPHYIQQIHDGGYRSRRQHRSTSRLKSARFRSRVRVRHWNRRPSHRR